MIRATQEQAMSYEELVAKIRTMKKRQGVWATVRWCMHQGFRPDWTARVINGV